MLKGLLMAGYSCVILNIMNWNVYLLIQKPAYQAVLFLLLTPVLLFIIQPRSADSAWLIATCTFALFLLVNSCLLWVDDSPWSYFFYSLASAVGYLLFITVVMRASLRILQLGKSEESAMAFLIIIYHPFALLLVMLTKWIVNKWF